MKRLKLIDFLRGYSIFTIALMHLVSGVIEGVVSKAAAFGGAGVHVFILCSGFGLYLSYLKKPLGYGDFLKRRFGKVWMPYVIAVLLWGIWYLYSSGLFPAREVLSHLLLYKMFSNELDTSLCYPYWFISTIIQFYLFWPLIVMIYKMKWGGRILMILSLFWSTIVGVLGYEEQRPWGSFFLQYLWEFALGMYIADRCMMYDGRGEKLMDIKTYRWRWLILGAVGGMGASAFMVWNGGIMKLYNDIPSLVGYLSLALLIYKVGIKIINRFFECSSRFGYELYLLHSLVYVIVAYLFSSVLPIPVLLTIEFLLAYIIAYFYKYVLDKIKIVR